MITPRDVRYLQVAAAASRYSTYDRIKIGAAIIKGNWVVSTGCNKDKTHPFQFRMNQLHRPYEHSSNCLHAEVDALVRSGREDLTGAEIYVYREDRNGSLAMCKPCSVCAASIAAAGINRVIYTTPNGIEEYYIES